MGHMTKRAWSPSAEDCSDETREHSDKIPAGAGGGHVNHRLSEPISAFSVDFERLVYLFLIGLVTRGSGESEI